VLFAAYDGSFDLTAPTTYRFSRGLIAVGLVGFLALAGVLFVVMTGSDADETATAARSGDPAPDVSFQLFDGTQVALADFRGQPLVLNFWASWCPACVAEMPSFQAVHAAIGNEVVFLGLDVQDTREAADAFVQQSGVDYLLGDDPDGAVLAAFDGIAMPTTVFIDEAGNVIGRHSGAIFEEDLRRLILEYLGV
jgi:cytochrome c biogenesis protein CcmG/thiol:disulfide interchange protein DsbE